MLSFVTRSLSKKLWCLFAVLLTGVLLVAASSGLSLNNISGRLERLVDVDANGLEYSLHLQTALANAGLIQRTMILDSEPEADRIARASYAENAQEFEQHLETLKPLLSTASLKHFDDVESTWKEYQAVFARMSALDLDGKSQDAYQLAVSDARPLVASIREDLDAIVKINEAEMEAATTAANSTVTSAFTIMGTITAISAITGGLLAFFIIRGILNAVLPLVERAQAIANRDLSGKPLVTKSKDEVGTLVNAVNAMNAALNELVTEVRASATEVAAAATEVSASSEELTRGVEEQSDQLRQVSSAVEEMSASINEVADKSTKASREASSAGSTADEGAQMVGNTINGMQQIDAAVNATAKAVDSLGERSESIGQVVEVINEIAEQTNLLALNAAIEAARAGEHGRGFAVVADEVRKLADRTTKATQEIAESINAIKTETTDAVHRMGEGTQHVKSGVDLAGKAGDQLKTIVHTSREVASMIQSIAAAAEQQSAASTEISSSVERIAAVSQQTTQAVGQSNQAAAELSLKAENLQALVGSFKTA
ncbi:MAG: methyl-accepting chemotaxis protein [Phycisphaerales bacterium]